MILFSLVIVIALFEFCLCDQTVTGGSGQKIQCNSANPGVANWCASGDGNSCYYTETGMTCVPMKSLFPALNTSVEFPTTGNGWIFAIGGFIQCPFGQGTFGHCGSHEHPDCSGGVYGNYCLDLPYPLMASAADRHSPTDDHIQSCPQNQIPCGLCHSGKDRDCSGKVNQISCCGIVDCTPTNITASWKEIKTGSTPGESVTVQYGVDFTVGESITKAVGAGVSTQISTGFEFEGIGISTEVSAEYAGFISQSASAALSVGKTVSYTASCDIAPYVLWQFEIEIQGNCGMRLYLDAFACTKTVEIPPCCLPGYAVNSKYTLCVPESPNVCENN